MITVDDVLELISRVQLEAPYKIPQEHIEDTLKTVQYLQSEHPELNLLSVRSETDTSLSITFSLGQVEVDISYENQCVEVSLGRASEDEQLNASIIYAKDLAKLLNFLADNLSNVEVSISK